MKELITKDEYSIFTDTHDTAREYITKITEPKFGSSKNFGTQNRKYCHLNIRDKNFQ